MKNYFNSNLKFIREQKNMSQNKFAKLLKVNQTTIARWEDENRIPTIDKAIDVSIILNIPLNILVGRDLRMIEDIDTEISKEEEKRLFKEVLTKRGFLNDNEELTEEDFNRLIAFAKANKDFIKKEK